MIDSTQEYEMCVGKVETPEERADREAQEILDMENPLDGDGLDPIVLGETEELV